MTVEQKDNGSCNWVGSQLCTNVCANNKCINFGKFNGMVNLKRFYWNLKSKTLVRQSIEEQVRWDTPKALLYCGVYPEDGFNAKIPYITYLNAIKGSIPIIDSMIKYGAKKWEVGCSKYSLAAENGVNSLMTDSRADKTFRRLKRKLHNKINKVISKEEFSQMNIPFIKNGVKIVRLLSWELPETYWDCYLLKVNRYMKYYPNDGGDGLIPESNYLLNNSKATIKDECPF